MASIMAQMEDDRPLRRSQSTANLLAVATLLELAFGTVLLVAPTWMAHMLTGAEHTSAETAVVLRNAAAGVLAIGLTCALGRLSESGMPRSRPLDLVPGLFVYYGCAVAVLADALMRRVQAPLLWPAMALHSALLVWCIICLAAERTLRH
jgi:Na+-driven multidrug efflux pump